MKIIESNNLPQLPNTEDKSDEEWMEYYWAAYQQQKCKSCGPGRMFLANFNRYKLRADAKKKKD